MPDIASTDVAGVRQRGYRRGALATDSWDPYVIFTRDQVVSFKGRAASFRIPGAGTISTQSMISLYNAIGSAVLVDVTRVLFDMTTGATKTPALQLGMMRLYRITVEPTGGAVIEKCALDSALTSSASFTLLQEASAHRTASTLGITEILPAGAVIDEMHVPRHVLTAVGAEKHDRSQLLDGAPDCTLRAGEGLVVALEDHVSAAANPATDWYTFVIEWTEYVRP